MKFKTMEEEKLKVQNSKKFLNNLMLTKNNKDT